MNDKKFIFLIFDYFWWSYSRNNFSIGALANDQ